jgi:hypothetical protein
MNSSSPYTTASPRHLRVDLVMLGITGLAVLATFGLAVGREVSPAWSRVQADVVATVTQKVGAPRAAKLPLGMHQLWIEPLSRVDRCTTCHIGIDGGADLADLPNPARSHPLPELIAAHPFEKFGCTLCHGGRGPATSEESAHADEPEADEPLLDTARARRYGLTAAELMEMRCNACHRAEEATKGMPLLTEAKALVKAKKCNSCHAIEGKGGTAGPDLSTTGELPPEHRHFPTGWTRPRTALGWHVGHMMQPTSTSPGSEMKVFGFSEREATALAVLVSSWKRVKLPPAWLPAHK